MLGNIMKTNEFSDIMRSSVIKLNIENLMSELNAVLFDKKKNLMRYFSNF